MSHATARRAHRGIPTGFTLLEVILALALGAILLAMLGTAMQVYLRATGVGRAQIQSAQLARALLSRIADDLRSSIQYEKFDGTGAAKALAKSASASLPEGVSAEDADKALAEAGASSDSKTSDPAAAETEAEDPVRPGVYGAIDYVQVDTGAAAQRPDSPRAAAATGLRTVTYFLETGGLYRRDTDRAAALWDPQQSAGGVQADDELLAEEVTALEFYYFDGAEWLSEWDSTTSEGLPLAVEIVLTLTETPDPAKPVKPGDIPTETIYRQVVRLPAAKPSTTTDTETSKPEAPADDAASSSNTGSGAGSGSGTGTGTGAGAGIGGGR